MYATKYRKYSNVRRSYARKFVYKRPNYTSRYKKPVYRKKYRVRRRN